MNTSMAFSSINRHLIEDIPAAVFHHAKIDPLPCRCRKCVDIFRAGNLDDTRARTRHILLDLVAYFNGKLARRGYIKQLQLISAGGSIVVGTHVSV